MPKPRFLGVIVAGAERQMSLDLDYLLRVNKLSFRIGVWSRLAVSLGRRQEARWKYSPSRLASRGVEVVWRPTGGLTILHHPGTLTIHAYAPASSPLYRVDVVSAAVSFASWLRDALVSLGYSVEYSRRPWERRRLTPRETDICLAYTGAADLYHEGKKVAAAALRRTSRGLLYQGYIILEEPWYELWAWVDEYPYPGELKQAFKGLGADVTLKELAGALEEAVVEPVKIES